MAATSKNKSTSTTTVVVWEWMTEFGRWRPYDPELVQYIEQYYGKAPQIYPGTVHPALSMYIIDFNRMCQIRQGSGTVRPVRRIISQVISSNINQIVWQFSGDVPGNWDMYDFEVGSYLETSYANGKHVIDMSASPFKLPYVINLKKMQQVRKETGTVRSIRRHKLQSPYPVAVLQGGAAQTVNNTSAGMQHLQVSNTSGSDSDDSSPRKKLKTKSSAAKGRKSGQSNKSATCTSVSANMPAQGGSGVFSHSGGNTTGLTSNQMSTIQNMLQHAPNSLPVSSSFQRPLTRSMFNNFNSGSLQHATPGVHNLQNVQQINPFTSSSAIQNMQLPPYMMANSQTSSHNLYQLPVTHTLQVPVSSLSSSVYMPHTSMPLPMTFSSLPGGVSNPYTSFVQQPGLTTMSSGGKGVSNMSVPVPLTVPPVPVFSPPALSSATCVSVSGLPQKGRIILSKPKKTKSRTADEVLKKYVQNMPHPKEDENCCICYDKLAEESSYGNGQCHDEQVVSFRRCEHAFHRQCLHAMYDSGHKDDSIQCPSCKTIYGERYGNCPPGEMDFHVIPHSLPGYPDNHTIQVSYYIRPGVQGPEHPCPGSRYNARGFPRVGFLPDTDQGRKVLQLLIIAWKRRLIFTIGMSTTTGENDTVTWNEIHHKTEFGSNVTGHGYPDENYLDNVTQELAVHGVTEDDL